MEYDGTRYHGSQYQENAPTIQGETERALEKLTGQKVRIAAASRTDAGVHARGQVVSFKAGSVFPPKTWVRGLNHYLPPDIAVKDAYVVNNGFDVRRDAWSREYRYSILNTFAPSPIMRRFTHLVPHPLDEEAMDRACQVLVGEHDFAPFCTVVGGRTRRRMFRAGVRRDADLVFLDMEANSFLPHQVRNTVGGLIRVGLGKTKVETFWELAGCGHAGAVGVTAPAQGLCLMKVNYHGFPPPFQEK
jgi:tRNA pseudouridine38-40 synthase